MKKSFSQVLNCKKVVEDILLLTKNKINHLGLKPEINVLISTNKNGKAAYDSSIYVKNKIDVLKQIGIETKVMRLHNHITNNELAQIIKELNKDFKNNGTLIQMPFIGTSELNIKQILDDVKADKDIDGLSGISFGKLLNLEKDCIKPATPVGICALLKYYNIKTTGKHVVIVGKGRLVGKPLSMMLIAHPFNATVTLTDIYTEDLKEITMTADILITCIDTPYFITPSYVNKDVIIIDAGISRIKDKLTGKYNMVGNVCPSTYNHCKMYTSVPGGVGLLTTATLAFNVLNACLLQNNIQTLDLNEEISNASLSKVIMPSNKKGLHIMLLSSSYNGLTQKMEKHLKSLGHTIFFQVANSDNGIRNGVNAFNPDLIICPTLMHAIPEDIYKIYKCLIVHPGIKGDRGPSSLDWAILNEMDEWGVTILQADKEMDAGSIWASETFKLSKEISKTQLYNTEVSRLAIKLITECIDKFKNTEFKPQPLDYSNPEIQGKLHETIKQSHPSRVINWGEDNTQTLMRKIKAADSQPGVKAELLIGNKKVQRFLYGVHEEKYIIPKESILPGQIFGYRNEAILIKTIDSAIWISQLRSLKTKDNPNPFKIPAKVQLGDLIADDLEEFNLPILNSPDPMNTFQEISFEKVGDLGILHFDFYNGAMSTIQCNRLLAAIKECAADSSLKALILAGSERNWSNGLNLNIIENAKDPKLEAWNNIVAINSIVKQILSIKNKITVSVMQANAGAGGVYLALAADLAFAKPSIVLNPHYVNMGLYGSELHTLCGARRMGKRTLEYLTTSATPLIVNEAIELGMIDDLTSLMKEQGLTINCSNDVLHQVKIYTERLVRNKKEYKRFLRMKVEGMKGFLNDKTIEMYEESELKEMYEDIINDRNSFSSKRKAFVHKSNLVEVLKEKELLIRI